MRLAFCLYHYFPFGGLQRDFLRIARTCLEKGHQVDVYTSSWQGPPEPGLNIHRVPIKGWQNHRRYHAFAKALQKQVKKPAYDLIVGFNKLPGLDVYYAADVCYQSRIREQRPFWYRWLPRYRSYLKKERAVFSQASETQVLVLAEKQLHEYSRRYALPPSRFHLLPPGISRDRQAPADALQKRQKLRQTLDAKADEKVLLLVGSGFKTKGLDRVLKGLAALPQALQAKTWLWVLGQDKAEPFLRLAKKLGLTARVKFLGGRHKVTPYFLAADLLVHPAYHENTGTVLLEAVVAGLPVLTVDVCGYAPYIQNAEAGKVLPSPFDQTQFDQALEAMLLSSKLELWKKNALAYAQNADIYSLPEKALAYLESLKEPQHVPAS